MACTLNFPFHSFCSSSTMSETIFPTVSSELYSPAFQSIIFTSEFSWHFRARCFPSFPRGFTSTIVISSRRKRGFLFPIPKGRNLLITSSVSRVIFFGGRIHSTSSVFFGSSHFPYFSRNFSVIAFWKSANRLASMVNPAACLCPPYRTKYSLHSSRSSTRLHQSGERQEATRCTLFLSTGYTTLSFRSETEESLSHSLKRFWLSFSHT